MNAATIYVTELDRQRLMKLLEDARFTEYRGSVYLEKLQGEIARAIVVEPKAVPPDVVTMNSRVSLRDLDTYEVETYTVVYPEEADIQEGKLSILAPIGTALLGYRVGQEVVWEVPSGTRRLRIEQVLYQPEAEGRFDM